MSDASCDGCSAAAEPAAAVRWSVWLSGVWHHAAPHAPRAPAARSGVSRFWTRTIVLAPRRARRSQQLIHTDYRIEIQMRVPGWVTAQEEFQPRGRTRGEGRILLELAREFILQLRVLCEHAARDLFGDVGLQGFLVLEAGVEEAPGGERVRRLRLEQVHHPARAGLCARPEPRAGADGPGPASPGARPSPPPPAR